MADIN